MTWKSRYEIFQPKGASPSPWASYDAQNPCGQGFANDVVTLRSFREFSEFNQMNLNPLVAQNHTYVRYEVRVNEPEFEFDCWKQMVHRGQLAYFSDGNFLQYRLQLNQSRMAHSH